MPAWDMEQYRLHLWPFVHCKQKDAFQSPWDPQTRGIGSS
ncbi:hypothetical protein Egran_06847 [Elaphomyces granulatus]|uniref:Uncharacterized protein n=1 Tax=Elaphomyces granulatus TaxID=519963 RepID=A0A232LML3_9EURO|nr:hypothetical protein Egran_06847 [Elaphomyces granulatus]